MKHCIYHATISCCDKGDSEHIENETDGVGCSKSEGVFQDKAESVPGRRAEVLSGQGYLYISILRYELYESLQAVEEIAGKAKKDLYYLSTFACLLKLAFVVLKDNSDELY